MSAQAITIDKLRVDTEKEIIKTEEYLKVLRNLRSTMGVKRFKTPSYAIEPTKVIEITTPQLQDQIIKMVASKGKQTVKRRKKVVAV